MNEQAERDCISRIKNGDESAFNELFAAYHRRIIGLALRLVSNEELALEIAQEVFLAAYQELHRWRGEARFSTWLFRTALNQALSYNREERKQQKIRHINTEEESGMACDDLTMQEELRTSIAKAVHALPPRQGTVFMLRRYRDAKTHEIASSLKISEAGVRASYYQAVRTLRFQLRSVAPERRTRQVVAS